MNSDWSAKDYRTHAGFVPELGRPVLKLLNPQPNERILDLGCGDGVLTSEIANAGASVLGVDSSAELVAQARARGLDVRQMDGQALALGERFDAVFSNAALHWMVDADAVLSSVRSALKDGGRFVAEMGGQGNIAAIVTAARAVLASHSIAFDPRSVWYFPSVEGYRRRLEAHGFSVRSIELIPRPTPLPTGLAGWLKTFSVPALGAASGDSRESWLSEIEELARPALQDEDGQWHADYVRLRFYAE
ncbi:MAG: methyltransferase domain-containing protein [Myxococcota bacterium]